MGGYCIYKPLDRVTHAAGNRNAIGIFGYLIEAAKLDGPAYAICDDTAIKVVDGEVEVVTEGRWRRFGP